MKPEESHGEEVLRYAQDDGTHFTPHPSPVLNLLHAHRISLFAHSCTSLNLFAIRTRFTPSVRKFALPQGAREQTSCAERTVKNLFTYLPINLFTFKNNLSFLISSFYVVLKISIQFQIKKPSKRASSNGRDDKIRTCDPRDPNTVRYQAALHPDDIQLLRKTFVLLRCATPLTN